MDVRKVMIRGLTLLLWLGVAGGVVGGCDALSSKTETRRDDDDGDRRKKKKKKKKKKRADDDGDDGADGDKAEASPKPPKVVPVSEPDAGAKLLENAVYKRIPSTSVEVPVPNGWKEFKTGLYSGVQSPDDKVAVVFTPVTYRSEYVGRVQDIERRLGITNERVTNKSKAPIGPNRLQAEITDATCNFHGKPGQLAYVLVQQSGGKRVHVLVVFVAENAANKADIDIGHAAILNLR
ncbi:MAG: hypothetical protein AAF715_29385 [Myxococcota bacterium]